MPALDTLTLKAQFLHEMHDPAWYGFINEYARTMTGTAGATPRARIQNKVVNVMDPDTHEKRSFPAAYDLDVDTPLPSVFWPEGTEGRDISRRLAHVTQMSHAYYVSPTMQVLITAASHDWPEDEPVREDDFPQPQGWLYIPGGGITTLDIRGRVMSTSVILWDCYGGGVDIHLLSDKSSPTDLYYREKAPEMWEAMSQLSPWHHVRMTFGRPVPRGLQMGRAVPPEIADQIRIWDQDDATIMTFPDGWSPSEMRPEVRPFAVLSWLLSCLRVMQQPLASVEKQGVPQNFRKGLSRYRVRMRNTHVSVIEYRRRAGEYEHGDSGRTLSHRHFRRGHWRRQPFKNPETGEPDVKVIRIQPTIVGDPSLPLMLREHVNAFVR
jgi:hypothetical protein